MTELLLDHQEDLGVRILLELSYPDCSQIVIDVIVFIRVTMLRYQFIIGVFLGDLVCIILTELLDVALRLCLLLE